jgi:hypothetical protein
MTTLVDRIVAVAESLERSAMPWALGGALALAYATEEPRGTRHIDINVFVPATRAAEVFAALPSGVVTTSADAADALRTAQVRVWWDDTPLDLFFAADSFHAEVARRCRDVPFEGRTIHVLCAEDLAVFKAMFDRSKDWVDIEAMAELGAIDLDLAADRLRSVLGNDDRVARLRSMPR